MDINGYIVVYTVVIASLLTGVKISFLCGRPLWVEFPVEEDTFAVEDQYMIGEVDQYHELHKTCRRIHWTHLHVGGALLACPVTAKGVQEVEILLPGSSEVNHSESGASTVSMLTGNFSSGCDLCLPGVVRHQLWEGVQRRRDSPPASQLADSSAVPARRLTRVQINRKWLLLC